MVRVRVRVGVRVRVRARGRGRVRGRAALKSASFLPLALYPTPRPPLTLPLTLKSASFLPLAVALISLAMPTPRWMNSATWW